MKTASQVILTATAVLVLTVMATCSEAQVFYTPEADKGKVPTRERVEEAFKECVKEADAEIGEVARRNGRARQHRDFQLIACRESKQSCLKDFSTQSCREFVEDYLGSVE